MQVQSIDPTITIHVLDRELRRVLAGTFETTPLALFVALGGRVAEFNADADRMMRGHLRTLGYKEREFRPACWVPVKLAWVRRHRWKEDDVWIKGNIPAILDRVEAWCGD